MGTRSRPARRLRRFPVEGINILRAGVANKEWSIVRGQSDLVSGI
jgi:hypothetical protein